MLQPSSPPHIEPREVRRLAGWPQHKLALVAHVGVSTVRLYEANPKAVGDPAKRARLDRVYADLCSLLV